MGTEIKKPVVLDGDLYTFECPNCDELTSVHVSEVNCKIFRHAVFFITLPPTQHTFSHEYRESVADVLDTLLIPGKITDLILNYAGTLPIYIPTEPINPHTPKEICDMLIRDKRILGCAKPFQFIYSPEGNYVTQCPYI